LDKAELILNGLNSFEIVHQQNLVRFVRNALIRAQEQLDAKRFVESKATAKAVLERSKDCVEAKMVMFDSMIGLGEISEAVAFSQIFQLMLDSDPNDCNALSVLATVAYFKNEFDIASELLQKAAFRNPDDRRCQVLYRRMKTLIRLKQAGCEAFEIRDFQTAYVLFTEALTVDPLNRQFNKILFANRAATLMNLGLYREAIADCNLALFLDERYRKAVIRRGLCFIELGDFGSGMRDLEYAWRLQSDSEILELIKTAKERMKNSASY
jgi:DnaJ family protein C protein 7